MQGQRLYDVEVLRVISMIGIVGGHCFSFYEHMSDSCRASIYEAYGALIGINPLLTYFSLPVFTAIAGYLLGMRGLFDQSGFSYGTYVIKKVRRLYLPAVLFSLAFAFLFRREMIMRGGGIPPLCPRGRTPVVFVHVVCAVLSLLSLGEAYQWSQPVTLSCSVHRCEFGVLLLAA